MSYLSNFQIENDELTFDVKNLDKSLINAIRRVNISEVPTVGFNSDYGKESDIKIEVNTSSLHNEFLSHRLSLIPIHYPSKLIDTYDRNKYEFNINVTNNTSKMMDVTTEHIQIKDLHNNKDLSRAECKKFFPPNELTKDYILLNKLKPNKSNVSENGESLKITMYADKNIGKVHSRYTPTCVSIITNKRDEKKIKIKLDEMLNNKDFELKKKNKNPLTENEKLKLIKSFMISEADTCFHTDECGEPNYFEFTIESDGRVPPHIILHKSINILKDKLDKFVKLLDDPKFITYEKSDCIMPSYDVNIMDENYTLGYLYQHYIYKLFQNVENKKVNYVSSTIPHPLINKLLIRISLTEKSVNQDYIKELFKESTKVIKKDLDDINKELTSNKTISFN